MKNIFALATSLVFTTSIALTQNSDSPSRPTPLIDQSDVPVPTAYQAVDHGVNHRSWQRLTFEKSPDGHIVSHTHQYEEVASGMYYPDANGNLQEAQEIIVPSANGAVAQQGAYQVTFANNLDTSGAVDVLTPNGKHLVSNILGLVYVDRNSGQSVVLGQIQDSQGELISQNQVLYPNAFSGISADVRYTYKRGKFDQDVILKEQLPTPESFGLNSTSTEVEVMTEFVNPPTATVQNCPDSTGADSDQTITCGNMVFGHGSAFDIGNPNNPDSSVPVYKQYKTIDGQKVLLEKVPVLQIQSASQGLPQHASIKSKSLGNIRTASKNLKLPSVGTASVERKPMKYARNALPVRGLVLDYVTMTSSETNFVFQGDTTYLVDGDFNLSGVTTIEGGTVIKFNTNDACALNILGSINCETGPYRPAVFTCASDGSVGETVPDYFYGSSACTGTLDIQVQNNLLNGSGFQVYIYDDYGTYYVNGDTVYNNLENDYSFTAGLGEHYVFDAFDEYGGEYYLDFYPTETSDTIIPNDDFSVGYSESGDALCTPLPPPPPPLTIALSLANGGYIHDARICNVGIGILGEGATTAASVQFVGCGVGFKSVNAPVFAGNILMSVVGTGFVGQNFHVNGQNITFDQGADVAEYASGSDTNSFVALTNCIFTAVSGYGAVPVATNHVAFLTSASGVFQSVGAANYYLVTNSPYLGAGTAVIDPGLYAQLATKTTYAPTVYSSVTFSSPTNFTALVPRDTNAAPTYGYHYDPLDYIFGSCSANATLNFPAGAAVGWYDSGGYGIALNTNVVANFAGTAADPCVFTLYSTVQEEGYSSWIGYNWVWFGMCGIGSDNSPAKAPAVVSQFTHFYSLAGQHNLFRDYTIEFKLFANNCEFYNLEFAGYGLWCLPMLRPRASFRVVYPKLEVPNAE